MEAIYLDTHVVVWLYTDDVERLPETAKILIESNDLLICPIVQLEIQYLKEIGRINCSSKEIIEDLQIKIDLKVDDLPFETVVKKATEINWTRDPFDRIIAASSLARSYPLITKDSILLQHLSTAIWDRPKAIIHEHRA